MKLFSFFFVLLAVLATTVTAWENEDHEIFDLVTELEAAEGRGTTFYSWLEVPSTASTTEIAKAYRKKSMQLHPDKNPGVEGIHERFARLGVISTILRNKESRERYDFFYKNGVPKWRGTGYYYSRFRPGLGSVFVFLTILTSGLHYIIQCINYKRDLERIQVIISKAKAAAWGPKLVPINGSRKVKVNLGESRDDDGRVETKWIDVVVDETHVYLLDPSGEQHLIDSSTAVRPAITRTWFIGSLLSLFHTFVGNKSKGSNERSEADVDSGEASSTTDSEAQASGREDAKSSRVPTVKAGGKRRKVVRQR
ncbi:uncharacterized protein LACBIDRAFT_311868 [Laccaria bicolor S238N-H82]|uniref:Predicted protein n=1 Tax=Laccaria bicolor (strain S238N-H82 / ATCC MYA-4686) TaxID=486041 RepID=B0CYH5_LACBS|nr:uncharacterized protein LACBIDRAFT_311868 [Laccaria bicolor S238N-H82]EDR12885.1 predicted protein [Laccaria bicolor S238N-H82]|eukprot:XP_001877149.1 predicted protein [Laccaria bicolor S238N-H82]